MTRKKQEIAIMAGIKLFIVLFCCCGGGKNRLIRALDSNRRSFMAILLVAFVLLQFSVSFCDVYTLLPGILASGDEGMLCEATGVFNAVVVSHDSDIAGMLSLLGKFFVTFTFLSKIAKEIFVTFSYNLSSNFFQFSEFLNCEILRL